MVGPGLRFGVEYSKMYAKKILRELFEATKAKSFEELAKREEEVRKILSKYGKLYFLAIGKDGIHFVMKTPFDRIIDVKVIAPYNQLEIYVYNPVEHELTALSNVVKLPGTAKA